MKKFIGLMASAALFMPAMAIAAPTGLVTKTANLPSKTSQTATREGLTYTARNMIIGVNSTGTIPAGNGDARYFPVRPFANSVVQLLINQGTAGSFVCTGSLLPDRISIVTAGHCVSGGFGSKVPVSTTAFFYDGVGPADILYTSTPAETVSRQVRSYFVNPDYTGEVIDQNDIAVLRLTERAPDFARGYELATAADLTSAGFNVYGLGARGSSGNTGAIFGTTRLRQGLNQIDFSLDNAAFGGFFTDRNVNGAGFFGFADYGKSVLSDFDNGLAANDASCLLGTNFGTAQFCNLGLGLNEVGVAGGDSGGPSFINGRLALITSYGLSFGSAFGDVDEALNSTFGEFSGFVPVGIHSAFIAGAVPEPGSWALMIAGFGLTGAAMRRQRTAVVTA